MEMVRGGGCLVLLVVGLGAGSGCGGSKASPPSGCARSLDEFCSLGGIHCSRTWDEVQAGQAMCGLSADGIYDVYEISDCGNYHRLIYRGTDTGASFYYDAASGQLVAVTAGAYESRGCAAGPPEGFAEPGCAFPDGAVPIDCGAPAARSD